MYKVDEAHVEFKVIGEQTQYLVKMPDIKLYFFGKVKADNNPACAGISLQPDELEGDTVLESVPLTTLPLQLVPDGFDTVSAEIICPIWNIPTHTPAKEKAPKAKPTPKAAAAESVETVATPAGSSRAERQRLALEKKKAAAAKSEAVKPAPEEPAPPSADPRVVNNKALHCLGYELV